MRAAAFLVALACCLGCDSAPEPFTFEEARATWDSARVEDYSVRQFRQISCDTCRDTPLPTATVVVRDGVVAEVRDPEGGIVAVGALPSDSLAFRFALTVDDAFALIEQAVRDSTLAYAHFDGRLGYPTSAAVRGGGHADSFVLRDLQPD